MHAMPKPARAGLPLFRPSPAQEKPIREGLSFLGMTAVFWSNILYAELELVYTTAVPLAATDSYRVFFNPDEVIRLKWTVENIAFVHAHEVYHYVRGDLIMHAYWKEIGFVTLRDGTTLPYHHMLMNAAADYVINAGLRKAGIGDMPKEGLYDPKYSAEGMESSIDVYAQLYREAKDNGGAGDGGEWGDGHGNFDIHVLPDDALIEEEKYGNGQEKRNLAITAAAIAAEAAQQGDMPGFLKRIIGDILTPKVRWEDQLASSMTRSSGDPGHDWSKFNKRMICRPDHPISFARRIARGCGTIVVGCDTSGSIGQKHLDRFFAEASGICSALQPRDLYVIWCDTQVGRVDHLEDPTDLKDLHQRVNDEGTGGGGGSDMRPIFDKVKELGLDPDMLVVLTDMYVTFPDRAPSYETIWCSVTKGRTGPFGRTIEVEV